MANLPADLPEDWTQGQYISPNGTEVGLDTQHGYNYLMQQVNATQTEVNAINTSLEDVAQETSVQQVITTIGTTTDSGGSSTEGSLMAKLNEILEQLGISTSGSTVQEVLEELLNQPKVVKHIETGIVAGSSFKGDYNAGYKVTIELTGFSKKENMFVFLDPSLQAASSNNYFPGIYIQSYTNTELIIGSNQEPYAGGKPNNMSYQVIEFY